MTLMQRETVKALSSYEQKKASSPADLRNTDLSGRKLFVVSL